MIAAPTSPSSSGLSRGSAADAYLAASGRMSQRTLLSAFPANAVILGTSPRMTIVHQVRFGMGTVYFFPHHATAPGKLARAEKSKPSPALAIVRTVAVPLSPVAQGQASLTNPAPPSLPPHKTDGEW